MSNYQRPAGGGYKKPGGYQKPAQSQPTQQKPSTKQAPQQGETQEKRGQRPAFRLAYTETNADGKEVAVKGENGKTEYVAAMWPNQFGGFNVKFEDGRRGRVYPVEDQN